ncbi:hypothetical protein CAF53_25385 (plasmid) [Sphingobium sp. LB126]|nr:hypothetical protein CAF53_25385 [Sphingobium sp. LB126]
MRQGHQHRLVIVIDEGLSGADFHSVSEAKAAAHRCRQHVLPAFVYVEHADQHRLRHFDNAEDEAVAVSARIFQTELIAQGFSAKEVAQAINIAPRTVEGLIDTMRLKYRRGTVPIWWQRLWQAVTVDAHPAAQALPLSSDASGFYEESPTDQPLLNYW